MLFKFQMATGLLLDAMRLKSISIVTVSIRNELITMMPDQMIAALKRGAEFLHVNRFSRLLRLPFRVILPYCFDKLWLEGVVRVKIFFGQKMRIVNHESIFVRIWCYGVFEENVTFYILSVLRSSDTLIDVGTADIGQGGNDARRVIGGGYGRNKLKVY